MTSHVAKAVCAALFFAFAGSIKADPLSLKERFIGQSPAEACADSAVTQEIVERVRRWRERFPALRDIAAKECLVPVGSFAGIGTDAQMRLLFVKDSLVQAHFELENVSFEDFLHASEALTSLHGKPTRVASPPFQIERWRRGRHELQITRSRGSGPSYLEVILRDVEAMRRFLRDIDHNGKIFEDAARKARANDAR